MYGKCNVHIGLRTALILNLVPVSRDTCISHERIVLWKERSRIIKKKTLNAYRMFLQQNINEPPCKT
jgi:hypothetical protein